MTKKALPLLIAFLMTCTVLCGCGSSVGNSKFTCSQCSKKVSKAYTDYLEEGTYLCEDCAKVYYDLLFGDPTEDPSADSDTETSSAANGSGESASAVTEEEPVIKTEFTLDEIIAAMNDGTLGESVIAVKKGDLFYTTQMLESEDYRISQIGHSNDNEYHYIDSPDNWCYPDISLSAGDQIVHFNLGKVDYSIGISRISEQAYCIPFGFLYDKEKHTLSVIEPAELDYADSYVGEDSAGYPSGGITEINGVEITDNPLSLDLYLCGEPDAEITIGGFEGTVFKEYTYRCDRIACLLETKEKRSPIIGQSTMSVRKSYSLSTDMAELTKEGYAVLISDTVNPLSPGTYALSGCRLTITD